MFQTKIRIAVPSKGQIKYNHTLDKYEVRFNSLYYSYQALAKEVPDSNKLKPHINSYFDNLEHTLSQSELEILFGNLRPILVYLNPSDIEQKLVNFIRSTEAPTR